MLPAEISRLVELARSGDQGALAELLRFHEPRLVRMVELRLDASLRRRLDPADVVQEGLLEAVRRFPEWCPQQGLPFQVWLRLIVAQSLATAQRRHLGTHMRAAGLEVQLQGSRSGITSRSAADAFAASITSPSQAAQREELRARVLAALEQLDELDREVVALRHFEGLTNEEVAAELAITPEAASKRFVRALLRLRPALESLAFGPSGEDA
jgi:RNA polymerase sigma-70 factor, ECF subfamily